MPGQFMQHQRKAIGKSLRFKVFERDGYGCQYCGNKPPEVVLEIDHIVPVSKGGTNDKENLLTACRDCNSGKSDRDLTGPSVERIRENAEDIKEKYDQMINFYKFQKKLSTAKEDVIDEIAMHWSDLWDNKYNLNARGRSSISTFLKIFTIDDIKDAMNSAMRVNTPEGAFKYMCGILHNKRREKETN